MKKTLQTAPISKKSPLELFEQLCLSQGWQFERHISELTVYLKDKEFPFSFRVRWHSSIDYLELIGFLNVFIPVSKKLQVYEVLSALSVDVRLGSFMLCTQSEKPVFRYGVFSYKDNPITFNQLADVAEEAIIGAEKLNQALQFILLEGKTSKEAIFGAFLEVMGEA